MRMLIGFLTIFVLLVIINFSLAFSGSISMITPAQGGTYPYEPGQNYGYLKYSWDYTGSSGYSFYGVKAFIDGNNKGFIGNGSSIFVSNNFGLYFSGRVELWERRLSDNQLIVSQGINFTFYMGEGIHLTAKNSFGAGIVYINGEELSAGSSGARVTVLKNSTNTVGAKEWQNYDNYWWQYRRWQPHLSSRFPHR